MRSEIERLPRTSPPPPADPTACAGIIPNLLKVGPSIGTSFACVVSQACVPLGAGLTPSYFQRLRVRQGGDREHGERVEQIRISV